MSGGLYLQTFTNVTS